MIISSAFISNSDLFESGKSLKAFLVMKGIDSGSSAKLLGSISIIMEEFPSELKLPRIGISGTGCANAQQKNLKKSGMRSNFFKIWRVLIR
jgi:hypothetical protein